MTRGREANTAHVVTGKTAPAGKKPYQQAAPESVLASVMRREADDLSATEQIRHAQEWAGGIGHLLHLWSAATRQALYPDIDKRIKARLTEAEGWRYDREHSRQVLQHKLRDAQQAGHDVDEIIERITAAPMDGARSVTSVLHNRLQRLQLPGQGHGVTWAQRTPQNALALAHELAAGLDYRRRELGEQALAEPRTMAHPASRGTTRTARLPGPAGRLRAAGWYRRGLPGGAGNHRPAAGGRPGPASRARAGSPAPRHGPGPGDRRRAGRAPSHEPGRAGGPGPAKANARRRRRRGM